MVSTDHANPPLSEQSREISTSQNQTQSMLDPDIANNSILSVASGNLNSSLKNMK